MFDPTIKIYARISLWIKSKHITFSSYLSQELKQKLRYNLTGKARHHSASEILLNKNTQGKKLE